MENKTFQSIIWRKREVLKEIGLIHYNGLDDYYVADELSDLVEQHVVRWFNLKTGKLAIGGILVGVNMHPQGALLRIKQVKGLRFWSVAFNDAVVFQRLTDDEYTLLQAKEFA